MPLDIVGCPDRRLTRAAVQHVARELADGETEVSVLLPDRKYRGVWHRVLHDRTAEAFLADLSRLPHANVTTVPFQLDGRDAPTPAAQLARCCGDGRRRPAADAVTSDAAPRRDLSTRSPRSSRRAGATRSGSRGEVRSVRVVSQHDSPTLELVLADDTGALSIVFLGRRQIAGVDVGTRLEASGTVGVFRNRLAMLNPTYQLLG